MRFVCLNMCNSFTATSCIVVTSLQLPQLSPLHGEQVGAPPNGTCAKLQGKSELDDHSIALSLCLYAHMHRGEAGSVKRHPFVQDSAG